MEDQMLDVVSTQETTPEMLQSKTLLKKEQRLIARLLEVQEAETRAQDRFQRAKRRLKRRRERLDRVQGKLALVRKQIADLQVTDQQIASMQPTSVIAATPASTLRTDAEEIERIHSTPLHETSSYRFLAFQPLETLPEPEVIASLNVESAASNATASEHEASQELEASDSSTIETETATPVTIEQEQVVGADPAVIASELDDASEMDISSRSNLERKPTNPLRSEQDDQPAARALSPEIQATKEAWVAAESAMQHARNKAHGLAGSISFLSQADALSNEFMEELVRKQAEANKALLKAQDDARIAYERFLQAQKDAEYTASQLTDAPTYTLENNQLQNQDHNALPPAEDNGADQTAKLHAIRLYKEW